MPEFTVIATPSRHEGEIHCNYGIEIISEGSVILRFEEITFSKNQIEYIAGVCNRCGVSPLHFNDVLENYLSDFEDF